MSAGLRTRAAWVVVMVTLVAAVWLLGPLTATLLHATEGSYIATPYTSLGLVNPAVAQVGTAVGQPIYVQLTNGTPHAHTYQWRATEGSTVLDTGSVTLAPSQSSVRAVSTAAAVPGLAAIVVVPIGTGPGTGLNVGVSARIIAVRDVHHTASTRPATGTAAAPAK